jgi:hypothetical protein
MTLLASSNFLHTAHVAPRCGSPNSCLPQHQDTIPCTVKISVLCSWRWAKDCPKHVELILEINKLVIVASSWFSILLYLHWWCTVKHKSSFLSFFLSFFLLYSDLFCLINVGVEGHCFTRSGSTTPKQSVELPWARESIQQWQEIDIHFTGGFRTRITSK